ncbi:MAG: hypothetical protein V4857_20560 [Pseudomonadota bacterium]
MSEHVLTPQPGESAHARPARRQHKRDADRLVLSEMHPESVVDHLDPEGAPVDLTTFGTVRETCPKCQNHHLNLILRQTNVRFAHLFCTECASCFDARYPDGAPALTI